jgi:hypothetical protein
VVSSLCFFKFNLCRYNALSINFCIGVTIVLISMHLFFTSAPGVGLFTPGCQIGDVDYTGCHQLVSLTIRPPRVEPLLEGVRLVTWTIPAVSNRCFDDCKITWCKVPTLAGGAGDEERAAGVPGEPEHGPHERHQRQGGEDAEG